MWQWFPILAAHWNQVGSFKNYGCLGPTPDILVEDLGVEKVGHG